MKQEQILYLLLGIATGYYLGKNSGVITGMITHTKQSNPQLGVAGRGWIEDVRPAQLPCTYKRVIMTT